MDVKAVVKVEVEVTNGKGRDIGGENVLDEVSEEGWVISVGTIDSSEFDGVNLRMG